MAASALLLFLLDAIIVSPSPNSARVALAAVVTVVVLAAIAATWRSNLRIERGAKKS